MKVLAVEDDPLSRLVLVSTLQALDCEVEVADTGEEAWSRLEAAPIRLVVADWRLPGIDGLELCRRIRARGGDYVYYILLTEVEANETNETLATEAGVDDFLSKPIVAHELRNRLRVARRILGYTVQVRQLESFLPICGFCQRVRNDDNYWQQIESYIGQHTGASLSRGICPDCYQTNVVPPLRQLEIDQKAADKTANGGTPCNHERRPTLSTIAQRIGVTVATVSMAMRNNPRISEEMRTRVKTVADEIGYRPDPALGKMMHRLRVRRPTTFKSILCALTTFPEDREPAYVTELIRGAQMQAVKRGYGITVMRLNEEDVDTWKLQRTLVSRGIEGLLLLPMASSQVCTDWLDWNQFSAVAANLGVIAPDLDRVVSHWYHSMLQAHAELVALGYRRIGVILNTTFDTSVHNKRTAAVAWLNLHGKGETVRPFLFEAPLVPPQTLTSTAGHRKLAHPTSALPDRRNSWETEGLKMWFEQERPDVLLVDSEEYGQMVAEELGLKIPDSIGLAVLNRTEACAYAGMTERPFEIGVAAIDRLDQKIQAGEKGSPAVPSVTNIKGYWSHGPTLRKGLSHADQFS